MLWPMKRPEQHSSGLDAARWAWGDDATILDRIWAASGVVAIPTESSYGLAVDPADRRAVEAVLRIKNRPAGLALPVVAGSVEDLERLGARLDMSWLRPVRAAWPAPLTAVVPLERPLPATLGLDTLAVRIPAHPRLRELLAGLGRVVTATSANRSGEPPVLRVDAVRRLLRGERAMVVDDGELPGGAPSTIVGNREGRLTVLREGAFPAAALSGG